MSDYKLCYVRGNFAYFTTQSLGEQWGDDWNDAPYEHNAGLPYTPSKHDLEQGRSWSIEQVAFDAELVTPDDGHVNSPYSVEQINAGAVAWLRSWSWLPGPPIVIPAGVSIDKFTQLVHDAGGEVYRRVDDSCYDWNSIALALRILDELADVWGDEGRFRRARDVIRGVVAKRNAAQMPDSSRGDCS